MRRGFLALIIVIALTLFYHFKMKTFKYFILFCIVGMFLVNQFSTEYFSYRIKQTQSALQNFDSSWSGREQIWKVGFEKLKQKMYKGYGYGANRKIIRESSFQLGYNYLDARMHNTYLKVLLELGIIGFTIYLSLILIITRLLYKCYLISRQKDQLLSILYFGMFAGWVALSIVAFFGYSGYLDKDLWIKIGFTMSGIKLLNISYNKDQNHEIKI
jgi:O-antigen ligase